MATHNFWLTIGAFLGGLIILPLVGSVFRYAFLGHEGTKVQKIYFLFIATVVAIGVAGFGDGVGDFMKRTLNTPDFTFVIGYGLAGLAVAGLISRKAEVSPEIRTTVGVVARFVALLFALPIGALALINLAGGGYRAFTHDQPFHDREYVKAKILGGEMAEMWRLVDERAPSDFQGMLDRLTLALGEAETEAEVVALLNVELARLRGALSEYSDYLADDERKKIIGTSLDLLKRVRDDPALCVAVAVTGGQNLPPEILQIVKREMLAASVAVFDGLLNARERAKIGGSGQAAWTTPPTDANYATLGQEIVRLGVTPEALNAAVMGDTSHPFFCEGSIGFSEGLLKLEGQAGAAVRWEMTKFMLSGVAG